MDIRKEKAKAKLPGCEMKHDKHRNTPVTNFPLFVKKK
jgi:hypothetical protein